MMAYQNKIRIKLVNYLFFHKFPGCFIYQFTVYLAFGQYGKLQWTGYEF